MPIDIRRLRPARAALLAITMILSACAGVNWHNADLPAAQESADESQCRREAEADVGPNAYIAPGNQNADSPLQLYDRTELRRRFSDLVVECMERKGYQRGN